MTETSCWSVWCPRKSWDAEAGGLALLAVRPSVPGMVSLNLPVNCPDLVCSVFEKLVVVVPGKPLANWARHILVGGRPHSNHGSCLLYSLPCHGKQFVSDCMRQFFRYLETFFSGGDHLFSGLNQTGQVPPSFPFILWKQSV